MSIQGSFIRNSLYLLILLLLIHLGFGYLLDFSVDEAHYALYGLHLDWSYFDHPPMVGWIQALPVHLGASAGLLRLIPEALWLITIIYSGKVSASLIDFSKDFDHESQASIEALKIYAKWFTAIIIMVAPILHVLAVGLLPDTLLIALIPLMQLLTLKLHKAINQNNSNEFGLWILLGVVLGLAGLSKYTSIFSALAIPVCLFFWHGASLLKRVGLWICLLIATLFISPIIYWNWQHEWISFIYQLKHGAGSTWEIRRLAAFILNQCLTYGLLPAVGLWLVIRNKFTFSKTLLGFFLIPFAIFLMMSGGGGSLPHWTSPAWVALAPISAIGLALAWQSGRQTLIKSLISIQLLICILGFTLLLFGGIPTVSKDDPLGKNNPIADLYGWENAGAKALKLSQEYGTTALAVNNWTLASRIAWYAKPLTVYVLDKRFDQFDIWFGSPKVNSRAIVINWSQMSFPEPTQPGAFKSCKIIDKLDVIHLGRIISSFDYLLCEGWGYQNPPDSKNQ